MGWPDYAIWINVLGTQAEAIAANITNTLQLGEADLVGMVSADDAVLTSQIMEAVLMGSISADSFALAPETSAAALVGVSGTDDVAVILQISLADLVAIGMISAANLATTPSVNSADLLGEALAEAMSVTPQIDTCTPIGTLASDDLSVTVQIDAAGFAGVLAGEAVSVTPQVAQASLTGIAAADSMTLSPQIGTAGLDAMLPVPADSISVTPQVDNAALAGTVAADSVTVTPQIVVAEATGAAQAGPTQPTISATAEGGRVTVALASGGAGADTFTLYWGTSAAEAAAHVNTISGVTLPYPHQGLSANTTYYYTAVAVNDQGSSTESAEAVSATTANVIDNFTTGGWTTQNTTISAAARKATMQVFDYWSGNEVAVIEKTFDNLSAGSVRFYYRVVSTGGMIATLNLRAGDFNAPFTTFSASTNGTYIESPSYAHAGGTQTIVVRLDTYDESGGPFIVEVYDIVSEAS